MMNRRLGIRPSSRCHQRPLSRPGRCHASSSKAYDLQSFIRNPAQFNHLDLSCSRELQEEGQLESLSEALMQSPGLGVSTLILRENNFGGAMSTLAPALRAISSSLTSLDLSHCNLRGYRNARNIAALSGPLGSLTSLVKLNLAHNDLGLKGAVVVAKALKKMTGLSSINLAHNDLADEGCIEILSSLLSNNSLTELDLTGNDFGAEGCCSIAELIENGPPLQRLTLSGNDLGSGSGALRISRAILLNPKLCESLEELRLSGCNLRDEGLKALAPAIASLCNLKSLNLDHNSIGSLGIESLSRVVKDGSLPALNHLSLGFNTRIGESLDGGHLSNLLSSLSGLKSLDLGTTNLHQPAIIESLSLLSSNLKLECLLLGGNRELLMTENVPMLAKILKSSRESMIALDLSSIGLELHFDRQIMDVLSSLDRLESLDLSGNPLLSMHSNTDYILDLPKSLKSLNVSNCSLRPDFMPYLAHQLHRMTGMRRFIIDGNQELESSILHVAPWILRTAAAEVKGAMRRKPRPISSSEKLAMGNSSLQLQDPDLSSLNEFEGEDFIELLTSAQEKFILSHNASSSYMYIRAKNRGPMHQ
jgi:Ran GTPase-activating protein (RanGAP) involved in mRNA processing and transport